MIDRRDFMKRSALGIAGASLFPMACASGEESAMIPLPPIFQISLAQWSLHKALFAKEMTNLEFPVRARDAFGIGAVEYVNSFMKEESKDPRYVAELKGICDSEGINSVLIMCDGEGRLGDPDDAARQTAVENHYRWVEIAKELGCHSIRVNASSEGDWNTQLGLAADGLRRLTEFGAQAEINVIVENHGGISSNGKWLSEVMRTVNHPRCGTLPDFGNFNMGEEMGVYDMYMGIEELMPFAKSVSAKSHNFDEDGNERDKDYMRILRSVLTAGYRGYIGVEYEGSEVSEAEGITLTKTLLERCRTTLTPEFA